MYVLEDVVVDVIGLGLDKLSQYHFALLDLFAIRMHSPQFTTISSIDIFNTSVVRQGYFSRIAQQVLFDFGDALVQVFGHGENVSRPQRYNNS